MKIPKSFTVGEEFFTDTNLVDVKILCYFQSSVVINPFEFKSEDNFITAKQTNGFLVVSIERKISKKLFYSLNKKYFYKFILGYIDEVLPKVNQNLGNQKYLTGHALSKLYSTLDIQNLTVINSADGMETRIKWPPVIEPFPPAKRLAPGSDHVFIRDYIDSTTCYFTYNLDECVRKIITSLENYFHRNNIKGTFKEKLNKCLVTDNYLSEWKDYLDIFKENISFIYKIRNNIVHDKLRLNFMDRWICKKGIGTLSYIYQSRLNDEQTAKYIHAISQQFLLLETSLNGLRLKDISGFKEDENAHFITKPSDLDAFMFNGLKIKHKDKQEIFSKL